MLSNDRFVHDNSIYIYNTLQGWGAGRGVLSNGRFVHDSFIYIYNTLQG